MLSCVRLLATPWPVESMEFSGPEYWSGKPFPSPWDLPNLGIELGSPALQVDSLPTELSGKPKKLVYNQSCQGTEDKLNKEEMRRDIIPEK